MKRYLRPRAAWPRQRVALLVAAMALGYVMFPQRAWAAGCGATDPGACMDNALYQGVLMIMAFLWDINQTFLLLARNVEALREWLVGDMLGTAFDAVVAGIQFPFWIAAAIAWLLFVIGYFLQMLVDGLNWINLKRCIQYGGLAVFLFHVGSQAMAVTEELRVSVGQGFASIAGSSASSSTTTLNFYAANDSSMDSPHTIYGDDPCPGMATKRAVAGMYLNDYTANYLWADAKDIHCPDKPEGRADVPAEFANRYAPPPMQIDYEDPAERQRKINLAWTGVSRMGWGLLLVFGALVEQVMHLLFALALASTWLGLLIALLFALFVATEGMLKAQITGIITTLRVSWLASFWMGLALSVLNLAARSGNGLIVGGVGLLALGLAVWQTKTAGQTFMSAMNGMSGLMGNAPSAVGGALKGIAGGPLGMAAGAAGALMGAGSAVMGAKDAYNTYQEAREKGLERWQALDHAQAAWRQRSINPLSRWRNEHRRERQMVREKLSDERLALQVAELHERYQPGGETLDEKMNEAADDNWADSRSYATPATGPTTPLDPAVATTAKKAPATRARRATPQPAVAPMMRCNVCQQELSEQEMRNHTCSGAAQADDPHTAETQPLQPVVVPPTTAQAAASNAPSSPAGTPAAKAGTGASDAQVVVVQVPPATPQAIGEDPSIQELLRHAREDAADEHTESNAVDKPELVVAPSPSFVLGSPDGSHKEASERMNDPAAAAPAKGAGVPGSTAGVAPSVERAEKTTPDHAGSSVAALPTATTKQSSVPPGHAASSPVPAIQSATSSGAASATERGEGSAAAPVPRPDDIAPQPGATPSAHTTMNEGPPATSTGTNGSSSVQTSTAGRSRTATVTTLPLGSTAQSNPTGATTGTDPLAGSSNTAARPSVSINSLPSGAVQVPVPVPAPSIGDASTTSTSNGSAASPAASGESKHSAGNRATIGAHMPKPETPPIISPPSVSQDGVRQHEASAAPNMPSATVHPTPPSAPTATRTAAPSIVSSSAPVVAPPNPTINVAGTMPTSSEVRVSSSTAAPSSMDGQVVPQAMQEAPRPIPVRPAVVPSVSTPAPPIAPATTVAASASPTAAAPVPDAAAPVVARGERVRPWQRAQQRRLAEPGQRPLQSTSEKKGRSV